MLQLDSFIDLLFVKYDEGRVDAVTHMLDLLSGRGDHPPDSYYRGPMPPELREWIDMVRDVVAQDQETRV